MQHCNGGTLRDLKMGAISERTANIRERSRACKTTENAKVTAEKPQEEAAKQAAKKATVEVKAGECEAKDSSKGSGAQGADFTVAQRGTQHMGGKVRCKARQGTEPVRPVREYFEEVDSHVLGTVLAADLADECHSIEVERQHHRLPCLLNQLIVRGPLV